jgi:hypothetical protein
MALSAGFAEPSKAMRAEHKKHFQCQVADFAGLPQGAG